MWAALAVAAAAAVLTAALVWLLLPLLRRLKVGQPSREFDPEAYKGKRGTPTMGGLAFILGASAVALAAGPLTPGMVLALVMYAGYGLLGFLDDYIKVVHQRPVGLKARHKLLGETALGLFLAWGVAEWAGAPTWVGVPFTALHIDLGAFYYPFLVLAAIATANGTNLTDGADGLLAGATLPVAAALGAYAWWQGQPDVTVLAAALAGALLGFLCWNAHPARIFMGDTGSMAIGGLLTALAALTKTELWLVVYGGLYVVETLSVIIQVFSFRVFGRRVIRMSPLHYHFLVGGWPERRVVRMFWAFSAACAGVALWSLLQGGA
ncbi:MAG: phospho-N-acetylmuramoyl-pentapeptide-transferase [Firmicutes bacterium]|nr:phospho-N-acetylmuramoyl-pentapeptide-transferase [Bacillota bacterium]